MTHAPRGCARWILLWMVALGVVTVTVRAVAPTGWLGSDDAFYRAAAEHLLSGKTIERVHHHYARMAVIVPTALSMRIFGDTVTAVILPTFAASVVCVGLVALLGRLLWGWWEGLCAATVVSVLPYFRVLSTCAYTDVHVCLWTTLAVLLAFTAAKQSDPRRAAILGLAGGFAVGLGTSAKVFALFTFVPITIIGWTQIIASRRARLMWLGSVAAGSLLFFLLEGLFYLQTGGDFWFTYHAHRNAQVDDRYFPATGYFQAATYAELVWNRLTLLFHPAQSGWGRLGILFWPVSLAALMFNRSGRVLAIWAFVTYVVIALLPINLRHGLHPYPEFDGRHVIMVCVPLALCLAWGGRRAAERVFRPAWVRNGWPMVVAAIVALSYARHGAPNGFRDRPTQRLGAAIERLVALTAWNADHNIFMPPSIYLRFAVLFPEELRSRLRVSADDGAPTWWRQAGADIVDRFRSLPGPEGAYLIATPSQLAGVPEFWDYGVGLPSGELPAWRRAASDVRIGHLADRSIGPCAATTDPESQLLVLLQPSPLTNVAMKDANR